MIFHGLQKMTLLDYPGKVACTVFTGGCNYRCPFCHNASLVTRIENETTYTEEDILTFLSKRKGLLDAICITGGEPLMHDDIFGFVGKVKEMGFFVKVDTNGSFPEKLRRLIDEKNVDYIAMDIKNSKEKYADTIKADGFLPKVEKSAAILLSSQIEYEFRTTVCDELHNAEDIKKIAEWIKGAKRYYIQGFIDSNDLVGAEKFSSPSNEKLEEMLAFAKNAGLNAQLRGID